jgi:hypothetical protein
MTDESRIKWQDLSTRWKASGESSRVFAAREGVNAGTLKWWSAQLRREQEKPADGAVAATTLVQVVRKSAAKSAIRTASVVIELLDAGIRISVEAGTDRSTLATVLDVLGARRTA